MTSDVTPLLVWTAGAIGLAGERLTNRVHRTVEGMPEEAMSEHGVAFDLGNLTVKVPKEHAGHRITYSVSGPIDGLPNTVYARCATCAVDLPQSDPEPTEAPGTGRCAGCGAEIHLRTDGLVPHHRRPEDVQEKDAPLCPGSAMRPVAHKPTEAPKTKAPTAGELAAALRYMANPHEGPPPLEGMMAEGVLQAAARRLEHPVFVIESDSRTDPDLVRAIEEGTGLPTFAVPPGTEITEIVPDDGVAAYVLTIPEGASRPTVDDVHLMNRLGSVIGKPVFLALDLKVEELGEDTMRRHGWVRAEDDVTRIVRAVSRVFDNIEYRAGNPWTMPLGELVNLVLGRTKANGYDADPAVVREVVLSKLRNDEPARDPDPEPLEPGVQWEHPLGGLQLKVDEKGGAWLEEWFGHGIGREYFVSTGAAERIIDVLSRWLPTQQDWTAPGPEQIGKDYDEALERTRELVEDAPVDGVLWYEVTARAGDMIAIRPCDPPPKAMPGLGRV